MSKPVGSPSRLRQRQSTARLLSRQRRLLTLLRALGGSIGNQDFQKLLFLYCQELTTEVPYEFVPYRFGAFSFTSYSDRRYLLASGLLAPAQSRWRLTPAGETVGGRVHEPDVWAFARRYRSLRGRALVAETYRRFPYYAIRSEIIQETLADDRPSVSSVEASRPTASSSRLFTIGYEGRSIENYLNRLLKAVVTVLCDVRRNAISRKYGFSKRTLKGACDNVGIRYMHLRELGIESSRRRGLETYDDYNALFAEYEEEVSARREAALKTIGDSLQYGERVALTCYERHANWCHRGRIAAKLVKSERANGIEHL